MFCPKCHAEYREGFTRCADCHIDLVPGPPPQPRRPQWPSPMWFLPAVGFYLFGIVFVSQRGNMTADFILFFLFLGMFATQGGTLWMLYQAIRYEERPLRYGLLSLLPFLFVWYYVERYKKRENRDRIPVGFR